MLSTSSTTPTTHTHSTLFSYFLTFPRNIASETETVARFNPLAKQARNLAPSGRSVNEMSNDGSSCWRILFHGGGSSNCQSSHDSIESRNGSLTALQFSLTTFLSNERIQSFLSQTANVEFMVSFSRSWLAIFQQIIDTHIPRPA